MTAAFAAVPTLADPVVDRAVAGDDAAFTVLVQRHRRELHGYCRGILVSPDRAEDAVQETLLRAWRARSTYAGRAGFRSWLYRIATNACLDELHRDRSRDLRAGPDDAPLAEAVSSDPGPDVLLERGEAVEEACRTIIELLPPRQRAVLILAEVLRFSSEESAQLLGTTVAAVNSARQRARATLHDPRPGAPPPRASGRPLLAPYVDALLRHDAAALTALARADAGGSRPRPTRRGGADHGAPHRGGSPAGA